MMFVKVCGVKDLEELEIVERYADATGVVVECESRRRVDLDLAREIVECSSIPVFLVSTLEKFEDWMKVVSKTNASYVQIHSNVEPSVVESLRDVGIFVMKAFLVPRTSVEPERDAAMLMNGICRYDVDMVLLDTGRGSGLTHDYRVSRIVAEKFDVVLAGGLNPENVDRIVRFVKPFGVDVSSGVERNYRKDEKLIAEFVRRIGRGDGV